MMNLLVPLAAAAPAGGPVDQIATTFGANVPALVANAISFILVALILKKWAVGPIQTMLEERRRTIAEGLANAEKTRAELAKAQAKAQEVIAQAGTQANKIIEEARAAASRLADQERQKAITDAQQILGKAREAGEAELARLKGELRKEFGRLVVQAASRSTGGILTNDQQGRLADEAVRQLSA